jgi:hypothetical protein
MVSDLDQKSLWEAVYESSKCLSPISTQFLRSCDLHGKPKSSRIGPISNDNMIGKPVSHYP